MLSPSEISRGNLSIKYSRFGKAFLITYDFHEDYKALMETVEAIEANGFWVNILGSFITIGMAGSTESLVTVHPREHTKKEAIWTAVVGLIDYLEEHGL
jgi:hypothetical protein